jgi:hypothetical protein
LTSAIHAWYQETGGSEDLAAAHNVEYPLALELQVNKAGIVFRTGWAVSRHFTMQDGLLDLDVARVRFEEVGELMRVKATEEVGIAALLRDGVLVKPSATKQSRASGTGLDVIIAADRSAPGPYMCDARACVMRDVCCGFAVFYTARFSPHPEVVCNRSARYVGSGMLLRQMYESNHKA